MAIIWTVNAHNGSFENRNIETNELKIVCFQFQTTKVSGTTAKRWFKRLPNPAAWRKCPNVIFLLDPLHEVVLFGTNDAIPSFLARLNFCACFLLCNRTFGVPVSLLNIDSWIVPHRLVALWNNVVCSLFLDYPRSISPCLMRYYWLHIRRIWIPLTES